MAVCGAENVGKLRPGASTDKKRSCAHTNYYQMQPDELAIGCRRQSKCAHTLSIELYTWRASAIDKWLNSLDELPTYRSVLLAGRVSRHGAYEFQEL